MTQERTVYTDDYGEISTEQLALYREFNVSPADHDELIEVYGNGETGRAAILAAVREHAHDGMYSAFHMIRAAQRRDAL